MGFILRLNKVGASLLIIFAMFCIVFVPKINAQETSDSTTLGVSPQLLEITANPGEEIKNTFRLTNGSSSSISIKTTPKNFTPLGEEGAVDLTEDRTSFSLAEWIVVSPETATIPSNKTQDFIVTINVPEDVEPGSHFGSVVFQTIPPEDDEAAALVSQEIAPVILVKVAGDISETAEIVEFKSTKSFWSNEPVITFVSRIKNTGTAHFKPTGQVVIKDMLGKEVAKVDLDQKNVLPDSIRLITSEWQKDGFKVGRFTAELTIVTGDDNQIETSKTNFTIFPYQIIMPVILIASLVGFVLFKGRRRIKLASKALSGKDDNKAEK